MLAKGLRRGLLPEAGRCKALFQRASLKKFPPKIALRSRSDIPLPIKIAATLLKIGGMHLRTIGFRYPCDAGQYCGNLWLHPVGFRHIGRERVIRRYPDDYWLLSR